MSDFPINPRIATMIGIAFLIMCLLFPNLILGPIFSSFQKVEKQSQEINCVTTMINSNPQIADNIIKHPEIIQALVENSTANLTVTKIVYVTVTPTPDGITYFAGEYQNGTRLLAHPYSWFRNDVNLPNNNLKISTNVYDFRIFPSLHYKDVENTDSPNNIYTEMKPTNPNNEYLIILVNVYADEIISSKTPDVWLPTQNNFALSITGITYTPISFPYQYKFKELEEITTQQNDYFIEPFGYQQTYTQTGLTNNELYNNGTPLSFTETGIAGNTYNTLAYIPKGSSNMIDGYILFEIPSNTPINQILVIANLFDFGNAQWRLYNDNSKNQ